MIAIHVSEERRIENGCAVMNRTEQREFDAAAAVAFANNIQEWM
jgi:hypothetical protein